MELLLGIEFPEEEVACVSVSLKMRPIVLNGRWIVRNSPATAAFSSSGESSDSCLERLRSEVERRGPAVCASIEFRVMTSGREGEDFSLIWW